MVIVDQAKVPVYLGIAEKAKHLRELGMSDKAIAQALGVSDKTVAKGIRRAAPTAADAEREFDHLLRCQPKL